MSKDYGMFSAAGNRRVETLVNRVLKLPITATDKQIYETLENGMKKISEKYDEVYDTDVRECVIGTIERKTGRRLTIYF